MTDSHGAPSSSAPGHVHGTGIQGSHNAAGTNATIDRQVAKNGKSSWINGAIVIILFLIVVAIGYDIMSPSSPTLPLNETRNHNTGGGKPAVVQQPQVVNFAEGLILTLSDQWITIISNHEGCLFVGKVPGTGAVIIHEWIKEPGKTTSSGMRVKGTGQVILSNPPKVAGVCRSS